MFVYVPFGNWNDCPDTETLMVVCKYWYEKYGAVPAVITSDQLECYVKTPVGMESVKRIGNGTISVLSRYRNTKRWRWYHWLVGRLSGEINGLVFLVGLKREWFDATK